ncbi:MAG: IclR family transcriptional regulator [Cytophagales bacterium]|nr:IclR family transcriptional regulator [Cytophagales bacterium]
MIQVITRAMDILDYVAAQKDKAAALSEIAEAVGINQSTCANIVKTLVARNYLEHMGRKSGYRLGPGVYQLTGSLAYNDNLVPAAKDVMERLTKTLNESCLLGILRNRKRFIVHIVHSDQDLQVRTHAETDIYPTATGRLLMSFLPPKELDALVAALGLPPPGTWAGVDTKDDLLQELRRIRQHEMALTLSPKHIVGLAVPIRRNQQVIASLSIYLPESRFTPTHREEIISRLREAAATINARLGQGS